MKHRYKWLRILAALVVMTVFAAGIMAYLIWNGRILLNNPSKTRYPVRGVDVSHYQGEIDWKVLGRQDIDFAYIKATEGSSHVDEKFSQNWSESALSGLAVGAYHFFSFDSSGKDQLAHFIQCLPDREGMLPPAVDVEFYGDKAANPPNPADVEQELGTLLEGLEAQYGMVPVISVSYTHLTPVTIAGETYDPSELSIDSGAVITIPNDAQFTDADKALETDLPEDHPQEVVARLVYTYNERRVGDAWIYSSRVQAVNATPSEPGEDTPQESQPEKDGQDGKTGLKLPRAVLIGGGAVLVLALIAGGGVFWFKRRQAAERERQRILREKRRQRLADIGYTEEDFERLLDERRKQHDMR